VGASTATEANARDARDRLRILRELGSPSGADVTTSVALETLPTGRRRLMVVERVARGGGVAAQDIAKWLDDARRMVLLEHRNVARVRDAIDGPTDGLVVSDFVDGARWAEVAAAGVTMDVAARVLMDALAGLEALHNLRDAERKPLGLVHCGVTADNVLVGIDGTGRVLGTARLRALTPGPGAHYLAPEVLLEDDAADARADVYSIGVLLWEALTGRPMLTETSPPAIVTAILGGRLPRADAPPSATWAAPLVDVAARALSPDPEKRYPTASAMASDIRRVAAAEVGSPMRVVALVKTSFGDRIKARREELERGEPAPRVASGTTAIAAPIGRETKPPSSSAPTPPTPTPTATTRPPPPLDGPTRRPPGPVLSAPPVPTEIEVRDAVDVIVEHELSEPPTLKRAQPVLPLAEPSPPRPPAAAVAPPVPVAAPRAPVTAPSLPVAAPLPPVPLPPAAVVALPSPPALLPLREPALSFAEPVAPEVEAPRNPPPRSLLIAAAAAILLTVIVGIWLAAPRDAATAETPTPTPTPTPTAQATAESPPTAPAPPAAPETSDTPPPAAVAPPPVAAPAKPRPVIRYDPEGI
jgi:serine/threonine-protein kinase